MEEFLAARLGYRLLDVPSSSTSFEQLVAAIVDQLHDPEGDPFTPEVRESLARGFVAFAETRRHGARAGLAFVSCRSPLVPALTGVLVRCRPGIVWPRADDNLPVRLICAILSPQDEPVEYLAEFERAVRILRFPHAP